MKHVEDDEALHDLEDTEDYQRQLDEALQPDHPADLVAGGQGRTQESLINDAIRSSMLMALVLVLGLVLALVKGCGHG